MQRSFGLVLNKMAKRVKRQKCQAWIIELKVLDVMSYIVFMFSIEFRMS